MTFQFNREPREHCYTALIRYFGNGLAGTFSLVYRPTRVDPSSLSTLQVALSPYLVKTERTNQWPGTTLIRHEAGVYTFTVTDNSMNVLEQWASGLYEWVCPTHLEDLAFYRDDGGVLLESIAHEHDARLYLTASEYNDLPPEIRSIVSSIES